MELLPAGRRGLRLSQHSGGSGMNSGGTDGGGARGVSKLCVRASCVMRRPRINGAPPSRVHVHFSGAGAMTLAGLRCRPAGAILTA